MPAGHDERPRRTREERPGTPERQTRAREPRQEPQAWETERDERAGREAGAGRTRRPRSIGAEAAARLAADQVARMTGREPEGITSLQRSDDGWEIEVEVLETARIPDSTDILAIYRAELDHDGELLAYQRIRRYARCQVEGR